MYLVAGTSTLLHADSNGADQPAHPRCPISTYKFISSKNLLHAKKKIKNIIPPSDPDNAGEGGGGVELLLEGGLYQFFF